MSISSSALASLVIAGTAIGGSTFAVMANTAPSESNSPSISQTIGTDPSAKLPGESTAPVDEVGNPINITPVSPTPVPTPKPTTPVVPPIDFGVNGDDDEDGNDDSYEGSDDDEDGGDDYGHDGYHGDDEDEEEDKGCL
ncbi:MAG: hypothetical protein NTW23_00655 [Rhodoluna sp.]|nr:hypothetical protein [Rhodoluna sp.]